MATSTIRQTEQKRRAHSISRLVLLVACVLLIIVNVVGLLFLRPTGTSDEIHAALPGQRIVLAEQLADAGASHRAVALTADNKLILLIDGKPAKEIQLEGNAAALGTSPDRKTLLVGNNERKIFRFDADLNPLGSFGVNGRVADVTMNDAGKIIAGYGIGKFTGKFWVGQFSADGKADYKKPTGMDVNVVTTKGDDLFYATADGKLVALSGAGEKRWETSLMQPALQLETTSKGNLIAGDERGVVYYLSPDGKMIWSQPLSEYKIRMLAEDPNSGNFLVGDADGRLAMLSEKDGQTIYQSSLAAGALRNLVSVSQDSLSMITNDGNWVTVNIASALNAPRQQAMTTLWLGANAVLGLTALAALVAAVPRFRAPALRVGRELRASTTAYLLILPAFILIIIFAYIPSLLGLFYSFTNFNLTEPLKFIGLKNFERLMNDRFFWVGVGNMILILITSLIKTLAIPLLVAELVYWLRSSRMKYAFRTAFIIPAIVPGVVGTLLWKMMYEPNNGLINQALRAVGLTDWARPWLADERLAIWAIIFSGFPWIGTFAFLIYLGGLLNVNRELFDAADIDGASALERFFRIDIPLLRPQIRLLLFFTFIDSVQGFGNIYIFTRGGPGFATYVPGLQMFLKIGAAEFGYAAAIGFVLALVVLVVTVMRFRFNQTPDMA